MQDKIVINDYIENDPLLEENLDKILEREVVKQCDILIDGQIHRFTARYNS